ncbi:MAG: O-antigen ligase family protein [Candidatus Yanofskybacteria bacterium]|nr:O-antigen ligase family protein [Candidatus Yanofskybacteria bacterium]
MFKLNRLNIVFLVHLGLFISVVTGIIPRAATIPWIILLLAYVFVAPLSEVLLFFIRSIPLFIAIPLTSSYDAFNMWRIISLALLVKWFLSQDIFKVVQEGARKFFRAPWQWMKSHPAIVLLKVLLILAVLSVIHAPDVGLGIKRIIYFVNLSFIGIVLWDMLHKVPSLKADAVRNIAIPTILVTIAGFIQLAMVYRMDIFRFVDIWVNVAEKNLFGSQWANIALKANTWFAYYGDQLSLRMFSLFPDSHSFPIFITLGLPAIFAISLWHLSEMGSLRTLLKIRAKLWITIVPFIFLAMLLSGTRGIWAASAGVVIVWLFFLWLLQGNRKVFFKYFGGFLLIFFLLLPVAYGIFTSDQFHVQKNDKALFKKRVSSIIDIAETSNKERLRIWNLSAHSIIAKPLLGVGIGNFPVVLNQDLSLSRAGSSAHNIYLHIAAEVGVLGLGICLFLIWLLMRQTFRNYVASTNSTTRVYYAGALLYVPWVLGYSLTDVALFDERAFLLFVVTCVLLWDHER